MRLGFDTSSAHAGNNCAFYDLSDSRLSTAQRFILDGGVWGDDGLTIQRARLATLETLRAEHSNNMRTGAAKL